MNLAFFIGGGSEIQPSVPCVPHACDSRCARNRQAIGGTLGVDLLPAISALASPACILRSTYVPVFVGLEDHRRPLPDVGRGAADTRAPHLATAPWPPPISAEKSCSRRKAPACPRKHHLPLDAAARLSRRLLLVRCGAITTSVPLILNSAKNTLARPTTSARSMLHTPSPRCSHLDFAYGGALRQVRELYRLPLPLGDQGATVLGRRGGLFVFPCSFGGAGAGFGGSSWGGRDLRSCTILPRPGCFLRLCFYQGAHRATRLLKYPPLCESGDVVKRGPTVGMWMAVHG